MKGTRPRGLLIDDDDHLAAELAGSEKDRAENLMITDMVRNDMGKIAWPGTVAVENLFNVETFFTVHQMVSTVRCKTNASLDEVFCALFPPASVTGAPKRRTMQILRDLESSPRGIYTGTIGLIRPDGSAQFNVAIRTATVNKRTNEAFYGVGGGIVWDSDPDSEWEECFHKAEALRHPVPDFNLFETFLWQPGTGFRLLMRHLNRLAGSARYFRFAFEPKTAETALNRSVAGLNGPARVRLTLKPDGQIEIDARPAPKPALHPMPVGISRLKISSRDRFLYHKTSLRDVYRKALETCPNAKDAILLNERGEVTESTIANVAVKIGGRLCTPPVACGLLPGTLRAEMLANRELEERIVFPRDLMQEEGFYLINSVRGMTPARLI